MYGSYSYNLYRGQSRADRHEAAPSQDTKIRKCVEITATLCKKCAYGLFLLVYGQCFHMLLAINGYRTEALAVAVDLQDGVEGWVCFLH